MPLGITGSDRKLLVIGGFLLLLMIVTSAVLSPRNDQSPSPVPSTYSAQSAGAEAVYMLLSRLHYPVRRWEDPPSELPKDDGSILLILADPTETPSAKEREAIFDFVEEGGHVLFTGSKITEFFPDANISWTSPDPTWASFTPNIPSGVTHGASHITIQPQTYWGQLTESQLALYGDANSHAVVSWSLGDGELVWWAGPTPLTNAGITRDDNLTFFLNSVSNWSKDGPYHIYWDEYFHGQRSSLWSYAHQTPLTWGLVQIALLAAAAFFSFSRRSGPVYSIPRTSRLWPLEYVDTLGGLYERARASSAAVSVSYQRLRFLLGRQLGLPTDSSDQELSRAAEERLGWKNFAAEDVLGRAETASRDAKMRSRKALELVQDLERHAEKLEIRSPLTLEKT